VSIQPIGAAMEYGSTTLTASTAAAVAHHHHASLQAVGLAAAAKALGMTVSDLRSTLLSGASLASVAATRGVSAESLAVAIPAALLQADPTMSVARATALAQRMLTSTRSTQTAHEADTVEHEHRGGAAMRAAFSAAAQALGQTRNDLADKLESGSTLSQLASFAGITTQHLAGAIGDAIARADSTLAPERAATIAQQLVQGAPPVPGHRDEDTDGD
jgi:hypothetical protein